MDDRNAEVAIHRRNGLHSRSRPHCSQIGDWELLGAGTSHWSSAYVVGARRGFDRVHVCPTRNNTGLT